MRSGRGRARREQRLGSSGTAPSAHPHAATATPPKGLREPAAGVAPPRAAAPDAARELLVRVRRGGTGRHRRRDGPETGGPHSEQQRRVGASNSSVGGRHLLLLQGPGSGSGGGDEDRSRSAVVSIARASGQRAPRRCAVPVVAPRGPKAAPRAAAAVAAVRAGGRGHAQLPAHGHRHAGPLDRGAGRGRGPVVVAAASAGGGGCGGDRGGRRGRDRRRGLRVRRRAGAITSSSSGPEAGGDRLLMEQHRRRVVVVVRRGRRGVVVVVVGLFCSKVGRRKGRKAGASDSAASRRRRSSSCSVPSHRGGRQRRPGPAVRHARHSASVAASAARSGEVARAPSFE